MPDPADHYTGTPAGHLHPDDKAKLDQLSADLAEHGPTGLMPRGPDRRTAVIPRRNEDAALHYAREALLAAALTTGDDLGRLAAAAVLYREADTAATGP